MPEPAPRGDERARPATPADGGPSATPFAAILLAGGRGRRLGGVDKPALTAHGRSLVDVALGAVAAAPHIVLVGPPRSVGPEVISVREDPPGGGPASALAAGVTALAAALPLPADALVVVCATDLPGLGADTVDRLLTALTAAGGVPRGNAEQAAEPDPGSAPDPVAGAILCDASGREQLLTGVWRAGPLLAACRARPDWTDAPLRTLLAPLRRMSVVAVGAEALDIDLPADLDAWRGSDR